MRFTVAGQPGHNRIVFSSRYAIANWSAASGRRRFIPQAGRYLTDAFLA
jgi:hypothetical protein